MAGTDSAEPVAQLVTMGLSTWAVSGSFGSAGLASSSVVETMTLSNSEKVSPEGLSPPP